MANYGFNGGGRLSHYAPHESSPLSHFAANGSSLPEFAADGVGHIPNYTAGGTSQAGSYTANAGTPLSNFTVNEGSQLSNFSDANYTASGSHIPGFSSSTDAQIPGYTTSAGSQMVSGIIGPPVASKEPEVLSPASSKLTIIQHSEHVCAAQNAQPKLRKAMDPPPIVKMDVINKDDYFGWYQMSPTVMMTAALIDLEGNLIKGGLAGTVVSSIHRAKLPPHLDIPSLPSSTSQPTQGIFIFPDLQIIPKGKYQIRYTVLEQFPEFIDGAYGMYYEKIASINSNVFNSVGAKDYKGCKQSTDLVLELNEQGIKHPIRKTQRNNTRKRRNTTSSTDRGSKRRHVADDVVANEEGFAVQAPSAAHVPTAIHATDTALSLQPYDSGPLYNSIFQDLGY